MKTPDTTKAVSSVTQEGYSIIPSAVFRDKASADPNEIVTLSGQFALAGHFVHEGKNRDYLVRKYGMSRYCQDAVELKSFARQLGVIHEL